MTNVVLVDHLTVVLEFLADGFRKTQGYEVTPISDARSAIRFAETASSDPPDAVVVDFLQPHHDCNGLDVMMAFDRWCPESAVVCYTEGSECARTLLTIAWEAIRPASVVSKRSPVTFLYDTVERAIEQGTSEIDPMLQSMLPHERSPWRSLDGYRRLVPHAGHAKIWKVLVDSDIPPSYKDVAERTSLSVNTVRNYREDLLPELRLHGLVSPTLQQMHDFARSVRPLLNPILVDRLAR